MKKDQNYGQHTYNHQQTFQIWYKMYIYAIKTVIKLISQPRAHFFPKRSVSEVNNAGKVPKRCKNSSETVNIYFFQCSTWLAHGINTA